VIRSAQPFDLIKRSLRFPAEATTEAKAVFKQVMKLTVIRDKELLELRDNYEGDHEKMVDEYVQKPPPWDEAFWCYVKKSLIHINSTRASLRTLSAGCYGGINSRSVSVQEGQKGPFADQVNEYVASPAWRAAMKRMQREASLYGISYAEPSYDKPSKAFSLKHLNPVTTHILTDEMDPEAPAVVAEFDECRNWVRIWTKNWYAVLARRDDQVEFLEYVDDAGKTVERPFFPILICKAEEMSGSPYGLSHLRDTPRFNRSFAVSYFNASFSALMKAQALLTIATDDGSSETSGDIRQIGPHTAFVLPKGAVAQFLNSNADVTSLMNVVEKLQDLLSYVIGIPAMRAQKNGSAESARLEATPLTSQVQDIATNMTNTETKGIKLLFAVAHWEVNSPATMQDVDRMYKVTVRISPSINVEPLNERVTSLTLLADKGALPEEDVVATFNPTMDFNQVEAQADVMRERRKTSSDPPMIPKSAENPEGS
jgi:hypothetical protein